MSQFNQFSCYRGQILFSCVFLFLFCFLTSCSFFSYVCHKCDLLLCCVSNLLALSFMLIGWVDEVIWRTPLLPNLWFVVSSRRTICPCMTSSIPSCGSPSLVKLRTSSQDIWRASGRLPRGWGCIGHIDERASSSEDSVLES